MIEIADAFSDPVGFTFQEMHGLLFTEVNRKKGYCGITEVSAFLA